MLIRVTPLRWQILFFRGKRGAIYAYGFITYFRVGVVCKRLGIGILRAKMVKMVPAL